MSLLRSKIKNISITFLISIFLFGLLVYVYQYFLIRKVQIEGVQDIKGIDSLQNQFLPLVNAEDLEQNLLENNPSISSISIFKQYPDTLFLNAVELRPVAILYIADGALLLAEDGTVLEKFRTKDETDVPVITYYQPIYFNQHPIGEVFDQDDILATTYFADQMLQLGLAVTTIDITNENMIVLHTDEFSVLVTSERDIESQYQDFAYAYKQLKREGTAFTDIDIRFDKPIIKLE